MTRFLPHVMGLLALLSQTLAAPAPAAPANVSMCGAGPVPADLLKSHQEAMTEELQNGTVGRRQLYNIEVTTYIHVVAASYLHSDGYVFDSEIRDQISKLNRDLVFSSIRLNVVNVSRTINPNWASGQNEFAMKQALRKGGYEDLNFYILKELPGGNLGVGTFPTYVGSNTATKILDGTMVVFGTLPGGDVADFNEGAVGTHEVGHWFGLLHPFDGENCYGVNDYVSDTPAMINPPFTCDPIRDSCPQQDGLDPWSNYMNYVPDRCKLDFTTGQNDRMSREFFIFRKPTHF